MSDLASITAVRPTINTTFKLVIYGATITAGQPVYLDTNDNEHKLADANVTAITAAAVGVAMTPGVDGGYGLIATGGSIILVGTTAAVGELYVVSATAGGIAPATDLTTSDYVTNLGTAASATQIDLDINATGIQHA